LNCPHPDGTNQVLGAAVFDGPESPLSLGAVAAGFEVSVSGNPGFAIPEVFFAKSLKDMSLFPFVYFLNLSYIV
jgi:hypothetical protein